MATTAADPASDSEEEECPEEISTDVQDTHLQPKLTARHRCTAAIDDIMEGDIARVPDLVQGLFDYFSEDMPPPSNKNLVAKHIAAKAMYVMNHTWQHAQQPTVDMLAPPGTGSEPGTASKPPRAPSLAADLTAFKHFAFGVGAALGPLHGVWIGCFAKLLGWHAPNSARHKWMQRAAVVAVLVATFAAFERYLAFVLLCVVEMQAVVAHTTAERWALAAAWTVLRLRPMQPVELGPAVGCAVAYMMRKDEWFQFA